MLAYRKPHWLLPQVESWGRGVYIEMHSTVAQPVHKLVSHGAGFVERQGVGRAWELGPNH